MLKIVSGIYRSRIIETPASLQVPTKSIVRTGLSNALMDKMEGAVVLDLFAGSGALGFEALSRGAKDAYFVDDSEEAIQAITKNIQALRCPGHPLLMKYEQALTRFEREKLAFDIVFLDPPYVMKEVYKEVPGYLLSHGLLKGGAAVVLEFDGTVEAPSSLFSFARTYNYGRTHVLILRR
jgi:16S rRNA (guanine966-N2)-methyltransferase